MKTLIKGAEVINEGKREILNVFIDGEKIAKISAQEIEGDFDRIIEAEGKLLVPGAIDDQVHFREPGLTNKAELFTESRAAVAGGITSYMEMPNTIPQATTVELLEEKYDRAAQVSLANYSFFIGTTNENLEELEKVDPKKVCGVKIFMGSSTGDMVVDNAAALENVFANVKMLIATHCEDDPMIKENTAKMIEKYGDDIPIELHPDIRSREACYKSSSLAVGLAKKHNARLHILHISTKEELDLFDNTLPLTEKRITAEACIHHMWFERKDYAEKGTLIKWNPAVKEKSDKEAILEAVKDNRIDVIATDHAPHSLEEKDNVYTKAPSGAPLVQHALVAMLELAKDGKISIEKVVEKMAHAPAIMFEVKDRGFIREGYQADLVLVDPNKSWTVNKDNILYKCGWSPLEGQTFSNSIDTTFVNGNVVYENGKIVEGTIGQRLEFDR